MDKVDSAGASAILNSSLFGGANVEAQKPKSERDKIRGRMRPGEAGRVRTINADGEDFFLKALRDLGPLVDVQPSEEAAAELLDAVRSAGDYLKKRPAFEEIIEYKKAVRNLLNYVVKNALAGTTEEGIPNKLKAGFSGPLFGDKANEKKRYALVSIIDQKLEKLTAEILTKHIKELELQSKVDEITGLLVDLIS